MVEALKRMDKKFLAFVLFILLLPILIVLILVIIRGCDATNVSYSSYEDKMAEAASKYLKEKDAFPTKKSAFVSVPLKELVDGKYIKSTERLLNDSTCDGEVRVRISGLTSEDGDTKYNYIPVLTCKDYSTNTLASLIMKDATSDEKNRVPGLYHMNNQYVFRGDSVNNVLKLYGTTYRILSVSEDGVAKLLKVENETTNVYWDRKYNTETNSSTGQNIYADSSILKKLNENYNNLKSKVKAKFIATNVCIGKRKTNNTRLYSDGDCGTIIEDQYISLINITDFANASLDPYCDSLNSKSCKNYNYLHYLNITSWTVNGVGDNTYEVYVLSSGSLYPQEADQYDFYNNVVYIDVNETVKSGKGTSAAPYVIE